MTEHNHFHSHHGATHIIEDDLAAELQTDRDYRLARQYDELAQTYRPIDPIRWRCLRIGSVSGRYEGAIVTPNPGSSELDLRVDIDPRGTRSPVLDRISGDFYRAYVFNWFGRAIRWRVYLRSWIVNNPTVSWGRCAVTITGAVTYWKGAQPCTTLSLTIPWESFKPAGPAVANFTANGAVSQYNCPRASGNFRDITLEVDVASSVNSGTILPSYDTHAHNDRPSGIQQRVLDMSEAYEEAGLGVTINHPSTVFEDSASSFNSWSVAELHDAMEGAFSQIGGGWPKWHMWGLLCGRYDDTSTAGIMFDAAAAYGGSGEAPERQGFAVFRDHSWFNNLPNSAPSDQTEAWTLRQFLYTWVHEVGHAFNFVHSWNKSRPNALSWMNYPQRVPDFWDKFEFEFDTEELIHLRHGDRAAVIMGGDAWATGLHLHGEGEVGAAEGTPPLELLVRSRGYFDFLEPVSVELRLRNLLADADVPIDARLDPRAGNVAIYIMKPDGSITEYEPVFCELGDPQVRALQPTGAKTGLERYSQEVSITFGRVGHNFATPGEYQIRAVYDMPGLGMIPSAVHRIRVGMPFSREEDRLAQDYFSFEAGLCMELGGSRSDYLAKGRETLETVAEKCAKTMVGAKCAIALANGMKKPFFAVDREKGKLRRAKGAAVNDALKLIAQAASVVTADPTQNIGYHMLARQRAELLVASDSKSEAKEEVKQMRRDLAKRGVNEPVLQEIDHYADSL